MREAKELLDRPQLDLVAEVLASGGTVKLRVFGSSMLPSLWPGDVLTIEGPPGSAIPGDIVLVLRNRRPLIHRVKEKRACHGRLEWITQGDAVPQNDAPLPASEMLGRVSLIERDRRVIVPSRQLSTPVRLLAWMLCHWGRFRSVCLRMHTFRQRLDQEA
jgi:signal peptidase I